MARAEIATANSVLEVRAMDAETGAPADTWARLWRLDLPESAEWTEGDEIERSEIAFDEHGLARIEGLPEGLYRLEYEAQRKGAEDPPALSVGPGRTVTDALLRFPREVQVRLAVFDDSGARVTEAELCAPRGSSSGGVDLPPSWARPRERRDRTGRHRNLRCGSGCGGKATFGPACDSGEGFHLGTAKESSQERHDGFSWSFRAAGRSSVQCPIDSDDLVGQAVVTYVAPSVDVARLLEDVVLPDGTTPDASTVSVSATASAVPADGPAGVGWAAWRDIGIAVKVDVPGHQALTFEWKASDPGPRRVLAPLGDAPAADAAR